MSLLSADGTPLKPTEPETIKIVICVPTRGECKSGFTYDLMRLVNATARARPDIRLAFLFGTGTLLHNLRCSIARDALQYEPDYLLWLDDDMRFPPDALLRLLSHQLDIVGTNYTTRSYPPHPTAKFRDADGVKYWNVPSLPGATHLEEVDICGFGCMLMKASIFASLPKPWFSMPYEPERDMHVGEDVYFCVQARNAGFPTIIDHGLSRELGHVGPREYRWDQYDAELERKAAEAPAETISDAPSA